MMKIQQKITILALPFLLVLNLTVFTSSCGINEPTDNTDLIKKSEKIIISKLISSTYKVTESKYPKLTKDNVWINSSSSEWTSGFYPGALWYGYMLSGDQGLKESALKFTNGLSAEQYNTNTHDLGFMIFNSFGNGIKAINIEDYKPTILQAAQSLATRYNEKVGCIQSWNGEFQVIIDNMINLELLFWASKNGGSQNYYDMAVSHAYKTIENHIREDGSAFHVVVYDPQTGNVVTKRTAQGYSDNSAWARGQAWGIYGFTMCYRETQNKDFLDAAKKMADFYCTNLPVDYIPYWDFKLPENYSKNFKDASAAAIALSGLIELNSYLNDEQIQNVIDKTYESLINNYLISNNSYDGLIDHCAYNVNSDIPENWDAATIWGDYYFIEAIYRLINRGKK